MGDPAGVGPEICLKLLNDAQAIEGCTPLLLGDLLVLRRVAEICNLPLPPNVVSHLDLLAIADCDQPTIVDFQTPGIESIQPAVLSAIGGEASYRYIDQAIRLALDGSIDAISTGPINKRALHLAGYHYPGHTEIFTEKTGSPHSCMMQYSDVLTCSFVTTHVGYAEVPKLLTQQRIVQVIHLSADAIRKLRNKEPKLVVCGLNPHAGEEGLFGDHEEERTIIPAIATARQSGLDIEGPLPPDTCFLPARRASTDCFICMYHDQGHIPLKALAFDAAVNCTLGLPIIRTSVDHGTAFDIAWKNRASVSSLNAAVQLAARWARTKTCSKNATLRPGNSQKGQR